MNYVYLLQIIILYLQNQTFKFIGSKLDSNKQSFSSLANIQSSSALGIIIKLFKIKIICL
jgi:hypothetical protein